MSELDQETIGKTQMSLGKVIQKPVLTEKLLKRPPFKFLHDIIVNVIKSTGFMSDVFANEDMIAENIKDKDAKMAFLEKCIDVLEIVTGEKVDLKPSKVVAGLEADKTNHFLQVLAEASILHKDSPTTSVPSEQKNPLVTVKKKTQQDAKTSSAKQEKVTKKGSNKTKVVAKQKDESDVGAKAEDRKELETQTDSKRENRENESSDLGSNGTEVPDGAKRRGDTTTVPFAGSRDSKASVRATASSPPRKETPSTRPTTARAAPPRVPRKQEADEAAALIAAQEESQRLVSAKPIPSLITEGSAVSDAGDALFLVGEATAGEEEDVKQQVARRSGSSGGSQESAKGSLMKHLMETKKELEGESDPRPEEKVTLDLQDVEKLRTSLQSLSRSANPLGRVLDALQEDMDAMLTELRTWAAEFNSNSSLLHTEQDSVDGEIDVLKARVQDLDQEISDQTEKIAASKAVIQQNEEKLRRVIALVVEKT